MSGDESDTDEVVETPKSDLLKSDFSKHSELYFVDASRVNHFPEGWKVTGLVKKLVDEIGYSSVVDFGCGTGRLCESFDSSKYLGIDIDQNVIKQAKKRFPHYHFDTKFDKPKYADIYLAYSVFLHLTDSELNKVLKKFRCQWLIVAEILGKEWTRQEIPPMYSRDLAEYVHILRSHDLILHKQIKKPHKKYSKTEWYKDKNTDISFMVFRKCLSSTYS